LRPPFAQERLRRRSDGRVALELKTAWHDGTRELVFEPLEFLERLAAMTPRPETNLLICHGVLAPRARWRERMVVYGRVAPEPTASTAPLAAGPEGTKATSRPRAWSWAALMHRVFDHSIECMSRRRSDHACLGHPSVSSPRRTGDRLRRTAAQLG
jgi:putative transposase